MTCGSGVSDGYGSQMFKDLWVAVAKDRTHELIVVTNPAVGIVGDCHNLIAQSQNLTVGVAGMGGLVVFVPIGMRFAISGWTR